MTLTRITPAAAVKDTIKKSPQLNFSTDKVLAILEYLADKAGPTRLKDLAADLGFNTSTTLRFITSLEKNGYIRQEKDTRQYLLTMKICNLSHKLLSKNVIVAYAKPFLEQMSAVFKEVTCLSIEQDSSVVYVATHDGPDNMLKSFNYIGKQAPMHCTGSGKLLLSNYSDAELKEYLKKKGNIKPTEHTINTFKDMKLELEKINKQKYSMDNEECEIGLRCVAVPVRDYTGKIIAGLSVTGPSIRMPFQKIKDNLPILSEASKELSMLLGYCG